MAGNALLDIFNSDQGRLGLAMLAAAGPQGQNMSTGQRIAQAMGQYNAGTDAKTDRELRRQQLAAQMGLVTAQTQAQQLELAKHQRELEEAQGVSGVLRGVGAQALPGVPGAPTAATSLPATPSDMGGTATPLTPPAGGGQAPDMFMMLMQRGQALLNAGYQKQGLAQIQLAERFKPEFDATPRLGRDPVTGKLAQFVMGKDGTPKVIPYGVAPDNQIVNLGGSMRVVDKNAAADGQQFDITQSADNRASNATTMRGQNMSDARARDANALAGRVYNEATGQIIDTRGGRAINVEGLNTPATPKMTEDQAKATGWLVQASNAWNNMQGAMGAQTGPDGKTTYKNADAARPGAADAIAMIPSMGIGAAAGQLIRTPDREKFVQASSSLSEALLRAATGAGVNKDEAAQKVRELTPVFGESQESINQKLAAIPAYIETLKVRAGPGAAPAARILDGLPGPAQPLQPNGKRGAMSAGGFSATLEK